MSDIVASIISVVVALPVAFGIVAILVGVLFAALLASILFTYKAKDIFDESKERALHASACQPRPDVRGAA